MASPWSIYKLVKGRCSFICKSISRRAPLPVKTPHRSSPERVRVKPDKVIDSQMLWSLTQCKESQHRRFEITHGQHTGFEDESALGSDLFGIHNFISEQLEAELICVYNQWCSGARRSGYTLNLCPQFFFKKARQRMNDLCQTVTCKLVLHI